MLIYFTSFCCPFRSVPSTRTIPTTACRTAGRCTPPPSRRSPRSLWGRGPTRFNIFKWQIVLNRFCFIDSITLFTFQFCVLQPA